MKTGYPACVGAMAGLLLLVQPAPGEGVEGAGKAPPPPAAKQEVPVLAMEIHAVDGGMEAEFTNHTAGEVGVKVGKKLIQLKPGEIAKFPIQKQEELNLYEKTQKAGKDEWKPRVTTMISPKAGKARYLGPG